MHLFYPPALITVLSIPSTSPLSSLITSYMALKRTRLDGQVSRDEYMLDQGEASSYDPVICYSLLEALPWHCLGSVLKGYSQHTCISKNGLRRQNRP